MWFLHGSSSMWALNYILVQSLKAPTDKRWNYVVLFGGSLLSSVIYAVGRRFDGICFPDLYRFRIETDKHYRIIRTGPFHCIQLLALWFWPNFLLWPVVGIVSAQPFILNEIILTTSFYLVHRYFPTLYLICRPSLTLLHTHYPNRSLSRFYTVFLSSILHLAYYPPSGLILGSRRRVLMMDGMVDLWVPVSWSFVIVYRWINARPRYWLGYSIPIDSQYLWWCILTYYVSPFGSVYTFYSQAAYSAWSFITNLVEMDEHLFHLDHLVDRVTC